MQCRALPRAPCARVAFRSSPAPRVRAVRTLAAAYDGNDQRVAAAGMLSALVLLSSAGGAGAAEAGGQLIGPARIVDGDTLYVQGEKIRLYAVDAPEKAQSCNNEKGAEYACGDKSLKALQARVGNSPVRCSVRTKDQYGRNVASCTILTPGQNEDMGAWLVRTGNAVAYRKISMEYAPLEDQARAARVGIWSGTFTQPAKWRYEQKLASVDEGDYPLAPAPKAGPAPAPAHSSGGGAHSGGSGAHSGGSGAHSSGSGAAQPGRSYADALKSGAPAPAAPTPRPAAPAPAAPALQAPRAQGNGLVPPDPKCPIKGNINAKGEKIYHTRESGAYDRTVIETDKGERWFCSEAEAKAAGFRNALR